MNKTMRLYGLRGAVCAENSEKSITDAVCSMCNMIFTRNTIAPADIVSVNFSITPDLTALNPAAALRRGVCSIDVSHCALFCSQEPVVDNMLPATIRVLVTAYMEEGAELQHVYIQGAEKLRPDFAGERT